MNDWFKVPGQNCPVALGRTTCETNLDCENAATVEPSCSNLTTTGTGLGWTSDGAIRSSSAGMLTCDPFRKVCTMEAFTPSPSEKPYGVFSYFTTFYIMFLGLACLSSIFFKKFDFLIGMSVHMLPVLITGTVALWVNQCCRKSASMTELILGDIGLHWLPLIIFITMMFVRKVKIKNNVMFLSGFLSVIVAGMVYLAVIGKDVEKIYNTSLEVLLAIYGASLFLSLVFIFYIFKK